LNQLGLKLSGLKVKLFAGGDEPISSNPFQARTYHGYFGIEATTVDFITNFINYNE